MSCCTLPKLLKLVTEEIVVCLNNYLLPTITHSFRFLLVAEVKEKVKFIPYHSVQPAVKKNVLEVRVRQYNEVGEEIYPCDIQAKFGNNKTVTTERTEAFDGKLNYVDGLWGLSKHMLVLPPLQP